MRILIVIQTIILLILLTLLTTVGCQQQPESTPPTPSPTEALPPTPAPIPEPAPPTPTPAPAPAPAPTPSPLPPVVDEPKLSEEEVCSQIWNTIPSKLPDGYSKDDLSKDTRTAEYEGDGKWLFSVSGKVRQEGPVTTETVKTEDYWVDRESCEVISYELHLTAVYYEKTSTLDISVEKRNEQVITETSDTPILRKEIKLKWQTAKGTAHRGYLEGRIENIGKIPITGLLIKYSLFDENGKVLTIEECKITPDTILPGETGKFMHDFLITGGRLHNYKYWFISETGQIFEYLEGSGEEEPVFFYEMDKEEAKL
jgi:hypothetical protein